MLSRQDQQLFISLSVSMQNLSISIPRVLKLNFLKYPLAYVLVFFLVF